MQWCRGWTNHPSGPRHKSHCGPLYHQQNIIFQWRPLAANYRSDSKRLKRLKNYAVRTPSGVVVIYCLHICVSLYVAVKTVLTVSPLRRLNFKKRTWRRWTDDEWSATLIGLYMHFCYSCILLLYSLLYRSPKTVTDKLQQVLILNSPARVIMNTQKYDKGLKPNCATEVFWHSGALQIGLLLLLLLLLLFFFTLGRYIPEGV